MGWIITQDEELMERFLAAKEMIYISNSALDEAVAYQFYLQKEKFASIINKKAMQNFQLLIQWLQQEIRLECILPHGGVVCFPRFKDPSAIDLEKFYSLLVQNYKTMVGPGHWFSMPDIYMRIGFGWEDKDRLRHGLENITRAINNSHA
jgi:aspartate/methionine/tyrosine aminotransferase